MKRISTQYRDDESVDYATFLQLLNHLAKEEFITLVDDKSSNFIQAAFDDEENPNSDYIVEMRRYDGDNFTHYRKFMRDFDQIIKDFDAFYHDTKSYDYQLEQWQDVTEEFIDTLTLDSKLSGETYDGYIATLESVMDSVECLAETGDFIKIFDESEQITQCVLLILPNFKTENTSYEVKFTDKKGESYQKTFDNLEFIKQIVNGFLQSQVVDIDGWHQQDTWKIYEP